jgi:chromosome partitioning protein
VQTRARTVLANVSVRSTGAEWTGMIGLVPTDFESPEGGVLTSVTVEHRAQVIVLGNEKGGSGKSTTAMHLIVGLLRDGYRVGAIDLDARQGTLSGYLAARQAFAAARKVDLPVPRHLSVFRSELDSRAEAEVEEAARFEAALADLSRDCDIVVIDCPGADTYLSRLGHGAADTLITPINDSFVDFAMLAKVDPDRIEVVHPSIYSEMVWQARKRRFARDRGRIDWIVMRNRMGANEARNKRDVGSTLDALAKRIGFRTVKGFGERVIFRELYLQGLTLMDVREAGLGIQLGMSHVAARAEVRALIGAIRKAPPDEGKALRVVTTEGISTAHADVAQG